MTDLNKSPLWRAVQALHRLGVDPTWTASPNNVVLVLTDQVAEDAVALRAEKRGVATVIALNEQDIERLTELAELHNLSCSD